MRGESRAGDWLLQAENDLLFAESARDNGFFSQCCFICQQAAEKALKAMLYARGAKAILTHSLYKLCEELEVNGGLKSAAGTLDQYYVSGRYPDALPGGAPFQVFTRNQADEAIALARSFIGLARGSVSP